MLETARLVIRPFTLEDAPFILRLLNEPSFIENIVDKGVRTEDQAREYLQTGPLASYEAHGHGLWWAGLKEGTPAGMVGLIRRPAFADVDLGYAFLPEHTGQGFAREAAGAVLAWGRERLGLARVIALINPGHVRSENVVRHHGFRLEGTVELAPGGDVVSLFAKSWGPE